MFVRVGHLAAKGEFQTSVCPRRTISSSPLRNLPFQPSLSASVYTPCILSVTPNALGHGDAGVPLASTTQNEVQKALTDT